MYCKCWIYVWAAFFSNIILHVGFVNKANRIIPGDPTRHRLIDCRSFSSFVPLVSFITKTRSADTTG
uniref:Uncharacterized protein n=1 Tax=Anguilla anguilla TaxID=7936 RepID=A0A0E9PFK9_ANGAN